MMVRTSLLVALGMLGQAALAQSMPTPGEANPRLQTIRFAEGDPVLLSILPRAGMTVILEAGERIERITVEDGSLLDVRVSSDENSFIVLPSGDIDRSGLTVETDRRTYPFAVRTRDSLLSGLLVQFEYGDEPVETNPLPSQPDEGPLWSYRLRGDREVRPASIRDDARRTFIEYAPGQALPAVFAVGPTGDEEVVNGYMREGVYVIDRVYGELVFRIDRDRATARRNSQPDEAG